MAATSRRPHSVSSSASFPSPPFLLLHLTSDPQREDVVKALHAEPSLPRKWNQCSNTVGAHFWTPKSAPAVNLLPALLKQMKVLLYHGDKDLMCSYNGAEDMIRELEWNGDVGFVRLLVFALYSEKWADV